MSENSPRDGLPGPLGLPPVASRGNPPPPPPLPDTPRVVAPVPSPATQDAADIIGFDLPPVEHIVSAVNDAADVVARIQSQIRTVLSTGLATADAIQGRISGQILTGMQSALAAGHAACDGVRECIVASTLAAIATVDQWMMTLDLPAHAHEAILAELTAIFGGNPPLPPCGPYTNPLFCKPPGGPPPPGGPQPPVPIPPPPAPVPSGTGRTDLGCPVGYTHVTGPFPNNEPCPAPPHVALPAPIGNWPGAAWYWPEGSVDPASSTAVNGWGYTINGRGPCIPVPPGHVIDNTLGQIPCQPPTQACCPSGPAPPTGPPAPPAPAAPCPCVTCNCTPCTCPQPGPANCGPGTHWDAATSKCVPNTSSGHTCPKGSHWDDYEDKCVPDQTYKYCVYCREYDQTTYLVEEGQQPEGPGDYILECYGSLAEVPPEDEWPTCEQLPSPPPFPPTIEFPSGSLWCSLDICGAIASFQTQFDPGPSVFGGLVRALLNPGERIDIADIVKDVNPILRPIAKAVLYVGSWFFETGGAVVAQAALAQQCLGPQYVVSQVVSTVVGILEKYLSASIGEVDIANRYYRHLLCPQLTLDAPQATAAYLADAIDVSQLQCLVGANNQCWEPWQAYLESQRTKLGPTELAQLRRRGEKTEQEYLDEMRKLGYTKPADPKDIYKLTTQIPFVSDLLRMLVRDVFDPTIPAWAESDQIFSQKWVGKGKEWGENQGVEDEYAKYLWRAHWSLPSPTQLYAMYHRLRGTPPPHGYASWLDAIKQTLVQQDILPTWVDPLVAVAFHPLTATDIVRAYSIGSIDEQGVEDGYKQLGYDDANATALKDFRRRERVEQARTLPQAKLYMDDGLSRTEFEAYLLSRNYPQADVDEVVALADGRKSAQTRKVCVSSLRKRYLKGELDANQLEFQLLGLGLEAPEAMNLVNRFACEFGSRDPHLAVKYLITLYMHNIIGVAEFVRRTGNLGILPDAAGLIVQQMDADLGDQAAARQAKAQRAAAKLAAQQAAAAARLAKQVAAAAAKLAKQIAAQKAAAAAVRKSIDATLKKCIAAGGAEAECTATIADAMASIESLYGTSAKEAAAIVALAVETTHPWSHVAFEHSLSLAIQEHIATTGVTE